MKLLVTGGLGFIGSTFIKHTLSQNSDTEIINVDINGFGANPESLKEIKDLDNYKFVLGDISNSYLIEKLVKDVDVIVNFAAETHVDRSIAEAYKFITTNILGTFTILESIRRYNHSVKYVQISTDEIYGDALEGSFNETNRINPSNPYSATKASADALCLAYHRTYDLNINITRCTNNFGPNQFPEKLIPKTTIRALRNFKIPLYGTGENVRDWMYVHDHCEAISLVVKKGKPGEIYNVSSGNEVSNIELCKEILTLLEKPDDLITFVDDRPGHDLRYSLDSSKIRSELGWKPTKSFTSALKETVSWYKNNDSWWKPLATKDVLDPTPWMVNAN
ncbi:dTDP-glucose 4,6-dehydratase [Candidatus Bathyarchaeota archaeon]|nr:dTDP-glucose 4,6-dehydratase [Candidatus Bathyarchaeota archaeon]